VAGGRNDAALAAADDQGLVEKAGVVALFDRGVEGVAVDVRDAERHELRMDQQPRRATARATCRPVAPGSRPAARPAEDWNGVDAHASCGWSRAQAAVMVSGLRLFCAATATSSGSLPTT